MIKQATWAIALLLLFSCSKDNDGPKERDVNTMTDLLTTSGWVLTESSTVREDCDKDDIYLFKKAGQKFDVSGGALKCDVSETAVLETGSWNFTGVGARLVMYFAGPDLDFEVVDLSAGRMELKTSAVRYVFTR